MQIIQTLCDRHYGQDEQVEADAGTQILRLNRREIEMDLCQACLAELTEVLDPWMSAGRRAGRAVAPVVTAGTPRRSSDSDGDTPKRYYKRDEPDGPNDTYLCRAPGVECERKEPANGFETSQGRGMHERRAHDYNAAQKAPRPRKREPVPA